MREELASLGDLVKALDDARRACCRVQGVVTRPSLKRLLARTAQVHQRVADALCERRSATESPVVRDGSVLRPWRVAWSRWLARASSDVELAYATQIGQREDRLLQRFRVAVQHARDPDIRGCLVCGVRELECARVEFGHLIALMEVEARVPWIDSGIAAPILARIPGRWRRKRVHRQLWSRG